MNYDSSRGYDVSLWKLGECSECYYKGGHGVDSTSPWCYRKGQHSSESSKGVGETWGPAIARGYNSHACQGATWVALCPGGDRCWALVSSQRF